MNSLITVNYNRAEHLENMLRGVSLGTVIPDEVIIINVGKKPDITYPTNLNIIFEQIPEVKMNCLPVGACRNLGFERSMGNNVIFLDVDCIASPTFIEKIVEQTKNNNGLIMGQPYYLFEKVDQLFSWNLLENSGIPHPQRPVVEGLGLCEDPGMFWSLCFAIQRADFETLGRFDESYTGYGAEDTDLSFYAREIGMKFHISEAIVYHQQHSFFKPPVNQLEAIVQNSNTFYKKWNHWCMSNHLSAFAELGLIDWNPAQNKPITILQTLEPFAMNQYYVADLPFS